MLAGCIGIDAEVFLSADLFLEAALLHFTVDGKGEADQSEREYSEAARVHRRCQKLAPLVTSRPGDRSRLERLVTS